MKNIYLRGLLSALCMAAFLASFTQIQAGPVKFNQVVQVVNARPGRAESGAFTRLVVAGDYNFLVSPDDDDKKKNGGTQDGRVITTTTTDIVKDDVCDCVQPDHEGRGFPKWALLGLAAIPIAFIIVHNTKDTPTPTATVPNFTPTPSATPTPTGSPTGSPTPTGTPTGTMTPTGSPTPTGSTTPTGSPTPTGSTTPTGSPTPTGSTTPTGSPTPTVTPTVTPTPPQPVPEPLTILLFGTGLASIGLAGRRKFGKKAAASDENEAK